MKNQYTFKDFVNLIISLGREEVKNNSNTEGLWDELMSDTKKAFGLLCPHMTLTHRQCAGLVRKMYEGV